MSIKVHYQHVLIPIYIFPVSSLGDKESMANTVIYLDVDREELDNKYYGHTLTAQCLGYLQTKEKRAFAELLVVFPNLIEDLERSL